MDNEKIGKYIASKRIEKGLTQNELGNKLYVTGKAVSKWERGLSLPDISILEKLADELDTDIYDILQIKKKKNIDISKILAEESQKIKKQTRAKYLKIVIPVIIILVIVLFKFFPFGYNVNHFRYNHQAEKIIGLAVPKFSFAYKNNDESYVFKNIRSKIALKIEIKNYLNTLEHLSCNNTVYYYDDYSDTTIANYNVKDRLIYSTISYDIKKGNYCKTLEVIENTQKLGGTQNRLYYQNDKLYFTFDTYINDTSEDTYHANLTIYEYNEKSKKTEWVELSKGTFEIKNDILIYTRENLEYENTLYKIPVTSKFVIKNKKLIFENNYLKTSDAYLFLERANNEKS